MNRSRLSESESVVGPRTASEVEVRELVTHRERAECVRLQLRIWGDDYRDVVPASLISAAQKAGGVAAGAFRADGEMVGFVYGIPALRDGRTIHWSHMLGVANSYRRHGVGKRLKHFQRDYLLARGVTEMQWTFDPLVAVNAHFNLNVLGAHIDEYVADMYGDTGSDLHSFGTDRLVARWQFAPGLRLSAAADGVDWARMPDLNAGAPAPRGALPLGPLPDALRVSIPPDIFALTQRDPAAGVVWREATRTAFRAAWDAGYRVAGFTRATRTPACHYLLRRAPAVELT